MGRSTKRSTMRSSADAAAMRPTWRNSRGSWGYIHGVTNRLRNSAEVIGCSKTAAIGSRLLSSASQRAVRRRARCHSISRTTKTAT
jgi:hypothetical protein